MQKETKDDQQITTEIQQGKSGVMSFKMSK